MNQPSIYIHKLIDNLTRSTVNFALYRQPWTDMPILVLQESGNTQIIDSLTDLNGQRGFLLAPFRRTEQHPIVLIRPTHVEHDWEAISETLTRLVQDRTDLIPTQTELPFSKTASFITQKASDKEWGNYRQAFERFIAPLQQKQFQKLVLSRRTFLELPDGFSPLTSFINACNNYPRMMISLCHTPETGTWLGSTPEIILSGHGTQWHTVSLAGTMPMQGDVIPTDWSDKNIREQAFVSDYIRRTIKQFGNKITEKGPYPARAGQLVHLKTDFNFILKDASQVGNILYELHPTPAVCGLPKNETYEFINENEGYDRRYYAGIIGWLDPEEDTSLYVNLRCMNIEGKRSTLYAGGGILSSSTLESEWEETQQKLNTMLSIL